MSSDEPRYQIGICPDCGPGAEQRLLFATEDSYGAIAEQGKIVAYELVETLSLFQCGKCGTNLLYSTRSDVPVSVDQLDFHSPDEVAELDPNQFQELSTLEWPTKKEPHQLTASVPENIRKIYEGALKVKALNPDAFAVQVRRAIQAICIDKGASEYDKDGRPVDLLDNLRELSANRVFAADLTDVLHQLRYLGNVGAHSTDETVKPGVADLVDELFNLLVEYIYEIPHKLERLKHETQTLRLKTRPRQNQQNESS